MCLEKDHLIDEKIYLILSCFQLFVELVLASVVVSFGICFVTVLVVEHSRTFEYSILSFIQCLEKLACSKFVARDPHQRRSLLYCFGSRMIEFCYLLSKATFQLLGIQQDQGPYWRHSLMETWVVHSDQLGFIHYCYYLLGSFRVGYLRLPLKDFSD